jgi:hypothetical protein
MAESLVITDYKLLCGRFSWDGGVGEWVRTPFGEHTKLLKLNFDPSQAPRSYYYLTDTEYGIDYQHTVRGPIGEFFFPCDKAIGKTLYMVGIQCDQVVKSEKEENGHSYMVTYQSGHTQRMPFSVYRPRKINRIESDRFELKEELLLKGDADCAICIESIHPQQLEVLECGHHFHSKCLTNCPSFSYEGVQCPVCRQFSR